MVSTISSERQLAPVRTSPITAPQTPRAAPPQDFDAMERGVARSPLAPATVVGKVNAPAAGSSPRAREPICGDDVVSKTFGIVGAVAFLGTAVTMVTLGALALHDPQRGSRTYAIGLLAGAIPVAVASLYAAGCTAGAAALCVEMEAVERDRR